MTVRSAALSCMLWCKINYKFVVHVWNKECFYGPFDISSLNWSQSKAHGVGIIFSSFIMEYFVYFWYQCNVCQVWASAGKPVCSVQGFDYACVSSHAYLCECTFLCLCVCREQVDSSLHWPIFSVRRSHEGGQHLFSPLCLLRKEKRRCGEESQREGKER